MKKVFILVGTLTLSALVSCSEKKEMSLEQQAFVDSVTNKSTKDVLIEEQKKFNKDSLPVKIIKCSTSEPNSAGGIDPIIKFKNTSGKVVKYITFSVLPYNRVGDLDFGEHAFGYPTPSRLRVVGPIKQGEIYDGVWDCTWYSFAIARMELVGVEIDYMDGSTFSSVEF